MGWKVTGQPLDSIIDEFQIVKFNKNVSVVACRTWFIVFNNPIFTGIKLAIYSTRNGSPRKLLMTSTNEIKKEEMIALENGVKEIYFKFDDFQAQKNESYAIVPIINGYAPNGDISHLAWKKAYPDPVYATGLTLDVKRKPFFPYALYFIGV